MLNKLLSCQIQSSHGKKPRFIALGQVLVKLWRFQPLSFILSPESGLRKPPQLLCIFDQSLSSRLSVSLLEPCIQIMKYNFSQYWIGPAPESSVSAFTIQLICFHRSIWWLYLKTFSARDRPGLILKYPGPLKFCLHLLAYCNSFGMFQPQKFPLNAWKEVWND